MPAKAFEFESAMKELEEIAGWFESDKVNLDEGLVKFERGMELASQLRTHLEAVGHRVEKVKARFDRPNLETAEAEIDTPPLASRDDLGPVTPELF